MASKDLKSNIQVIEAFNPNIFNSTPGVVLAGSAIDMINFESLDFVLQVGNIVGGAGDVQLVIEDADNFQFDDNVETVDANFLVGDLSNVFIDTSFTSRSIGYVGHKQFVRASLDIQNVATSIILAVVGILGNAHSNPTSD